MKIANMSTVGREMGKSADKNHQTVTSIPEDVRMKMLEDSVNPKLTSSETHKLAQSPLKKVRKQIAAHPNSSEKTLLLLAGDSDIDVRIAVAVKGCLTEAVMRKLINHEDDAVLSRVAMQRYLTKPLVIELVNQGSYATYRNLGANPHIKQNIISFLSTHPIVEVRRGIASNPNLNKTAMDNLIEDPIVTVRLQLASNPNLSTKRLMALLSQEEIRLLLSTDYSRFLYGIIHIPNRDVACLELLYEIVPKNSFTALLLIDVDDCPSRMKVELVHNFRATLPKYITSLDEFNNRWKKVITQYLLPNYPEVTENMPIEWLESLIPVFEAN